MAEQAVRTFPRVPNLSRDETDIFLIFNLHGFFITLSDLSVIKGKNVILRLSDLWWLTDHCAFPGACTEFYRDCLHCPNLQNYPPVFRDQRGNNRRLKRDFIKETRPTVVCPSDHAYETFIDSGLARFCRRVVMIPSSTDENIFFPGDKFKRIRGKQGLVALFVADGGLENFRKGGVALKEFLESKFEKNISFVNDKCALTIIIVGGEARQDTFYSCGSIALKLSQVGKKPHQEMAELFRAADFTLLNASEDNLPNCGVESMACGTPLVVRNAQGLTQLMHEGCIAYEELSIDLIWRVWETWSSLKALRRASSSARIHYEKNFSRGRESQLWLELIHDSIR